MSRHSTGETYPNEECSLDENIEVIDVNNETNDDLEVDQIHLNSKKTPNLYSNISCQ